MCATFRTRVFCVLSMLVTVAVYGQAQEQAPEFSPTVSATCKAGRMAVRVQFPQSFNGAVHAKGIRIPSCLANGNGSDTLSFDINLMAAVGAPDYCGIIVNNRTEEKSLSLVVRAHRTLELAEDKYYIITCGKSGSPLPKNETSLVSLGVVNENGEKLSNVFLGKSYVLRADLTKPDSMHGIRMKNCIAFNRKNTSVPLIDDRGCAVNPGVSAVKYSGDGAQGELTIHAMFKFPDSSQLNLQCNVAICKGVCPEIDCSSESMAAAAAGADEVSVLASTGVFVLEPGDSLTGAALESCKGMDIWHPAWLLYLAIALGVMFLIMLLINCFLCTAMTCSCARTEVLEKDPSVVEDYDPYRSWHGSQYGTRYPSSTIHSARSVSDNSDHYAIVQSRPGSRHSGVHRSRH